MDIFIICAARAEDFKTAFDAWVTATSPTTVHQILRGHVKGEWIIRFTP
jgi:hypothetical protein